MIGTQPIGAIAGVVITAVSHEGLTVTADGKPAQLGVALEGGTIVAVGPQVAREVRAVSVNSYRNFLQGQGWVRVFSEALSCAAATPAHTNVVISAVSHEGPTVTVDGLRAHFAVVAEDEAVVAVGEGVAREAEAVAVNAFRDYLMKLGHLRILPVPVTPDPALL